MVQGEQCAYARLHLIAIFLFAPALCRRQLKDTLNRYVLTRADIEFRTGVHVTDVDVSKKQLTTADKDTITYEKLIIATGARVRACPRTHGSIWASFCVPYENAIHHRTCMPE